MNPMGINFLEQIRDAASHTPDFLELKKSPEDEFLVFIYGAMKKGKRLHSFIEGANYYGRATTTGDNYLLKKISNSSAPIVFDLKNRWTKKGALIPPQMIGKVEGEVYGVPLRTITKIDRCEDNGRTMHRQKRFIRFKEQPRTSTQIESVFMYLAERDFWEESVSNLVTLPGGIQVESGGERFFYYV